MTIRKYIKNVTTENLPVLNRDLLPNEVWEISTKLWTTLYEDEKIIEDLLLGKIEVSNDGATPLNVEAAINLIQQFQPDSSGFGQRYVVSDITIKSNEEMIISDTIEVTEAGTLDVGGLLTILGE